MGVSAYADRVRPTETRETYSVFKERVPAAFDRLKTKFDVHALDERAVPGAGIEPASLESKASVLPLDDRKRVRA